MCIIICVERPPLISSSDNNNTDPNTGAELRINLIRNERNFQNIINYRHPSRLAVAGSGDVRWSIPSSCPEVVPLWLAGCQESQVISAKRLLNNLLTAALVRYIHTRPAIVVVVVIHCRAWTEIKHVIYLYERNSI